MLTDECKEVKFPSIEDFQNSYINTNFNGNKIYSSEVWTGNTYRIKIRDNVLSTGIYSDVNYIEDYYTINYNNQLNISEYVEREKIEEETIENDVRVSVENIDFYMDYAICNLKVHNGTENDIILDNLNQEDSILITDNNEVEYEAYINELQIEELTLLPGEQKDISIKFNIAFRSNINLKTLILKKVIVNEQEQKEVTIEIRM